MSLEIVFGPMFSGKSTYALSYIRRNRAIGLSVVAIKPNIDTRYGTEEELVTHDKEKIPCIPWDVSKSLSDMYALMCDNYPVEHNECIVIEEAQFFKGLLPFVKQCLSMGRDVLVVGLDGDASQKPFGEIFECIPYANKVTKINALCFLCRNGMEAPYTIKIADYKTEKQVDVGGSDKYVSVCFKHMNSYNKEKWSHTSTSSSLLE